MSIPRVDKKTETVKVNGLFVDYGFAQTMGMKLVLGSDFDRSKNNSGVLVNESAIKALGLKEVIGEQTAFGPVIGVVKDFNIVFYPRSNQPNDYWFRSQNVPGNSR